MLAAIGEGIKLLIASEGKLFTADAVKVVIWAAIFNAVLLHDVITNWKNKHALVILLVACITSAMLALEITGVKELVATTAGR